MGEATPFIAPPTFYHLVLSIFVTAEDASTQLGFEIEFIDVVLVFLCERGCVSKGEVNKVTDLEVLVYEHPIQVFLGEMLEECPSLRPR